MKTLFLEAPYEGKMELSKDTLEYIKKKNYHKIALFASIQFVNQLDTIKKQLESLKIEIITSKADRAKKGAQLLGCDVYYSSLNLPVQADSYLYIGDGRFHPLALVYAQKSQKELKEVICADPAKGLFIIDITECKRILRKYRAALLKFLSAKSIGVVITIKPGQEHLEAGLMLEKKYPDKNFYYFIDNVISFEQLENFNFISVWVNTACPRVGLDDQERFVKGVINLNDALKAEEVLGAESLLNRI